MSNTRISHPSAQDISISITKCLFGISTVLTRLKMHISISINHQPPTTKQSLHICCIPLSIQGIARAHQSTLHLDRHHFGENLPHWRDYEGSGWGNHILLWSYEDLHSTEYHFYAHARAQLLIIIVFLTAVRYKCIKASGNSEHTVFIFNICTHTQTKPFGDSGLEMINELTNERTKGLNTAMLGEEPSEKHLNPRHNMKQGNGTQVQPPPFLTNPNLKALV